MRSPVFATAWVLGTFSVATRPAWAQADKKAECAAAYEQSQELRGSGQLVEAEVKLRICSDEACPSFVRTDCSGWLEEVQRDVASIAVTAKDGSGEATTKVKVLLGDTVLAEELSGDPIPLNPGKHTLRFELEGADPIEKKVELDKGDKGHAIEVSFASKGGDIPDVAPYASAGADEDEGEEPKEEEESGKPGKLRPYAYIAGGVGAAGIITWAVVGAMGKGEESDLRDTCSPNCAKSKVDSVRTKYLIADISLGVGIAGLGAGVALFFLSQPKGDDDSSEDAARMDLDVRSTPGGGFATVSGRF